MGLGVGPLVYDEVDCIGDEERLSDCSGSEVENWECFSHEHDVGVICLDRKSHNVFKNLSTKSQ